MVVSGVKTIVWGDNVSGIEHAAEHLSQVGRVLAGLLGQFCGAKWMVCGLQDFEDSLSLRGKGCAFAQERCDGRVVCAEPLDGGDVVCISNDLVSEGVGFCAEVVFDGDEEAPVFGVRMAGDEEAGANGGDDADGAAALIEWVLGTAFIEMANDHDSTVGTFGQKC